MSLLWWLKIWTLKFLKIEQIIENDKNVILEITDIMEKVTNGFFEYTIKTKSSTKELQQTLVDIINKMMIEQG